MSRWTNDLLNEMRKTGDPLADAAADALFHGKEHAQIFRELKRMAGNDSLIPDDFPGEVQTFFKESEKFEMSQEDIEMTRIATDIFNRYGFRLCGLLYFKSLPTGYQCARPAKVLGTTKLLEEYATRRVLETSQFIFDVCKDDWYLPDGKGIRSTQKVRLMHAGMRHMILHDSRQQWDENHLGIPINQEDMVLTLQLFSLACIRGLELMGVKLHEEEKQAYFHHWRKIGQVLGIDSRLEPVNMADGWDLQNTILKRQLIHPNQDGPPLTSALLGIIEEYTNGKVPKKSLENITMYFVDTPECYKYLGLHKPSVSDRIIDTVVKTLLNMRILHLFHHDCAKDEEPGFLARAFRNILAKRFDLDAEQTKDLKTDLMEHITKAILVKMTRDAITQHEVISSNTKDHRSIFIETKLVEEWELGGFAFDAADQV